jgi:diphthamide synthase (EF-2-diphthine--ammonia ligase)
MLDGGLKARIVCVDPSKLPARFAGQDLTRELMAELPPGTDPCGENGEFHTFVYAGPMFSYPIGIESGEVVTRDGFVYADVRLAKKLPGKNQDQVAHLSQALP